MSSETAAAVNKPPPTNASGPNRFSMDQSCDRLTVIPRARSCCIAVASAGNLLKNDRATIAPPRIIGIAAAVRTTDTGLEGTPMGFCPGCGRNAGATVETTLPTFWRMGTALTLPSKPPTAPRIPPRFKAIAPPVATWVVWAEWIAPPILRADVAASFAALRAEVSAGAAAPAERRVANPATNAGPTVRSVGRKPLAFCDS
jgi:hypothetical protein